MRRADEEENMSDLAYTTEHEWVRLLPGGRATVGITDFAQSELGDIVYIELPEVGASITQGAEVAIIESTKAASSLNAPVDGIVEAINPAVADEPTLVNRDPLGEGWFITMRITDPSQLNGLLDDAGYAAYTTRAE